MSSALIIFLALLVMAMASIFALHFMALVRASREHADRMMDLQPDLRE